MRPIVSTFLNEKAPRRSGARTSLERTPRGAAPISMLPWASSLVYGRAGVGPPEDAIGRQPPTVQLQKHIIIRHPNSAARARPRSPAASGA
jgi:hypothetical protein